MVYVVGLYLSEIVLGVVFVAQAVVSECEHVETVYSVFRVECGELVPAASFPDEEVGQRDSEIVHGDVVEDVLLAVVYELVEEAVRLVLLS